MTSCNVTVFTTIKPATLGKTYKLGVKGLDKTTAGQMSEGTFEVRAFDGVQELAALLSSIRIDQALCASVPVNGSASGRIVTKAALKDNPGALSRTKDCFGFSVGAPALVSLDYDPHGPAKSRDELWALLQAACPALADSGVVWLCSGSSHVYSGDTELQGLRGQRFYFVAADGADVVRFGEALAACLWLAEHGRIDVSASGSLLERGIFDAAMFQPARLDFIGGGVMLGALEQRCGLPVILNEGTPLDTRTAMPTLTADEAARVLAAVDDAKAKAEPAAAAARAAWITGRMESVTERLVGGGLPAEQAKERAERTLNSALGGVLMGDFEITLEGGKVVTVAEILNRREAYDGALCLDALNPGHRNGAADGKLYLFGATPMLFSFDDGGVTYKLRRQPMRLYLRPGCKSELATEIVDWLSREPDVFTRGGVLVQIADGAVRPVRKHRLTHLVGSRVALYRRSDKGQDVPVDVPGDVIDQVAELAGG